MAIVAGYLVLSLPFSIVAIVRPHAAGPRLLLLILDTVSSLNVVKLTSHSEISNSQLILTKKSISTLFSQVALTLNTAAGAAAAAIVYLAHNGNSSANWLAICNQFGDFCQKSSGAVVASFIAALVLLILVVISALALRKH